MANKKRRVKVAKKKAVLGKAAKNPAAKIAKKRIVGGTAKKRDKYASLLANAHTRQLLIEMAGENAIAVIREFTEDMSDSELARRVKIKVSEVRAVLNKMHSEGLVRYTRNRDKESGWYTYIWSVNDGRMKGIMGCVGGKGVQEGEAAGGAGGETYVCKNCGGGGRIPFEKAVVVLFRCSSCGSSLSYYEG